jgi:triacylglycerol lipase
MNRRARWCVTVAAAVAVPSIAWTAAKAAAPAYPVSYDFVANAAQYGDATSPPGANDWQCRPSSAHPEPVVLVHGTLGSAGGNWATYSALLADAGYCVYALTYGVPASFASAGIPLGGLTDIEGSAHQLAAFVAAVLASTGAAKVDIVGHSQGTLMPDYYVKFLGGAKYVDKYISLAPLWHGVGVSSFGAEQWALARQFGYDPSNLPLCGACAEMEAGSPLIDEIDAGSPAVSGVAYTNIVTEHDELVIPYTSGIEPGMTNIVLQNQCPTDLSDHTEIASDPVAAAYVLNALDPAQPQPIPCELVLPALGPLPAL